MLIQELQAAINGKTKPPGSLGRLEEIALQAGLIQNTTRPVINAPHIAVFAADHGIAARGLVNPYPQEVTAQMVLNFLNGGAAINVFCRQNNIALTVVDAGVKADFNELYNETFIDAAVAKGTNDYSAGDAMDRAQVMYAIAKGKQVVQQIALKNNCNCIGFGEMGIGNTSSATLIMSAILQIPVEECTGLGTGVNDEQLAIKKATLKKVFALHGLDKLAASPLELLSKAGGFEIAEMVGAYLQAYEEKMIIVVDGFIATSALLLATLITPQVTGNCIYAHTSSEKGHAMLLDYLKAKPLLELKLRLGEGTGAALAIPIIQSAVNFLNQMASFETAAVSNRTT